MRKIESEQHKYLKLLSSLDPDAQLQGLELQDSDPLRLKSCLEVLKCNNGFGQKE